LTYEEVKQLIIDRLEVDPEEGIVRLFGTRFCLATPSLLVVVQRELESIMGSSAKAPIYMSGEGAAKTGAAAVQRLIEEGKFSDPEEAVKHLSTMWSAYGHGRIMIDFVDVSKGRVRFTIKNSLIAEAYGPSEKPVCHFYAGYGAGIVSALVGKDLHCEEVACIAMGADRCEFEIAPLEYFASMLPRVMSAKR
jgi:predicted hydrocarbon binding protein